MKSIKELTEEQAREILEFAFPDKGYHFTKLSFDPVIDEKGSQQLTFGLRSIVGIEYHNHQDNCILHFDHTKVILWLYKNEFDILEFLEDNQDMSKELERHENLALGVYGLSKGETGLYGKSWNLDSIKTISKDLLDSYYY